MSRMSDMAATIEELRSAAAAINEAANWLAQQFSGSEEAPVEEANGMVATMLIICSGFFFPIFRRRQPAALRK